MVGPACPCGDRFRICGDESRTVRGGAKVFRRIAAVVPERKIAQRRNKRRGLYAKSARRRMPSPLRVQARAGCARR
jgi:hypothetical protein